MVILLYLALILFAFLALDRVLLFIERIVYAKYDKFLLKDTDPSDLKIEKE